MQRRSLLKLGAASAIVLLVGAGIATYWQTGLKNGKLTVGGRDVFLSVARAILDGSLPTDPTAQQAALDGLLARIDGMAQAFPPHVQSELAQLLGLLATGAGRRTLAGLQPDWSVATVVEVQQALQSMRVSGLALRQQSYQALHDIVGAAYFSDSSTWATLGYPGPINL